MLGVHSNWRTFLNAMLTAREPHKSIPQIDYGISSPDLLFSFSGTLELAQFAAGRAPRLGHDAEKCSFNFGPDGLMRRHDYTVEGPRWCNGSPFAPAPARTLDEPGKASPGHTIREHQAYARRQRGTLARCRTMLPAKSIGCYGQ
jgi:hypothetical protein